jgi:hypothetical protein
LESYYSLSIFAAFPQSFGLFFDTKKKKEKNNNKEKEIRWPESESGAIHRNSGDPFRIWIHPDRIRTPVVGKTLGPALISDVFKIKIPHLFEFDCMSLMMTMKKEK